MTEPQHSPPGYEVTRDGRVFSIATNWRGYGRREMVAKHRDKDGYPYVRILIDGKRTLLKIHTLVALRYLPPRPSIKHQIRHLDGNPLNSSASNLAWGTNQENVDDRERHGRTSRGSSHSRAVKAGLEARNV
jgi:hypothetical protein